MYRINREGFIRVHVVQVTPHGFQRDVIVLVLFDYLAELRCALVSCSALVPTEGPSRDQPGLSHDKLVIANDVIGLASRRMEEHDLANTTCTDHVEIDNTSKR